ncbi:MAG: CopG family transcriptional regulator [Brevundimonas sp.]|nr:CopG family transcriptional regulator [Brevundimonas sp.]
MSEPPHEFQEQPAVFDDVDEAELRRRMADMDAGNFITNEAMMRWIASWGTENPLPPPECGE